MSVYAHILRLILAAVVMVQLSVPGYAAPPNLNGLSGFFCNPATPDRVSPQAQQAVQQIFALAGKDAPGDSEPDNHGAHCEHCLVPLIALAHAHTAAALPAEYAAAALPYTAYQTGFFYQAQGPPLGGRAPPYFV